MNNAGKIFWLLILFHAAGNIVIGQLPRVEQKEQCTRNIPGCPRLLSVGENMQWMLSSGVELAKIQNILREVTPHEFFEMSCCEMERVFGISRLDILRISRHVSTLCEDPSATSADPANQDEPKKATPDPTRPHPIPPYPSASNAIAMLDAFRDDDCGAPPAPGAAAAAPAFSLPADAVGLSYFLRPAYSLFGCSIPGLPLGPDGLLALPAGARRLKVDAGPRHFR